MRINGPLRSNELLDTHADVPRDLPEQRGRDVASCVERHRRDPTVFVPELLVRSTLANFDEAEALEYGHDLAWTENG